jgi:hypothetical protein
VQLELHLLFGLSKAKAAEEYMPQNGQDAAGRAGLKR